MKIGVLSDSHDNMPMIQAALDLFAAEGVEAVIHAGDFVAPFAAKLLVTFAGPVYTVFGNNDGEQVGLSAILKTVVPGPLSLDLGGRRIVVHHWIDQVPQAVQDDADIIITGHTHQVVNELLEREPGGPRSRLILNPGESCGWLTGRATAAILDTESLSARIVTLGESKAWKI